MPTTPRCCGTSSSPSRAKCSSTTAGATSSGACAASASTQPTSRPTNNSRCSNVEWLREELAQRRVRLLGCFFGEEVAAVDGLAADVVGPVAPDAEDVVPLADLAACAPQG